jgi:hypothetical protein
MLMVREVVVSAKSVVHEEKLGLSVPGETDKFVSRASRIVTAFEVVVVPPTELTLVTVKLITFPRSALVNW